MDFVRISKKFGSKKKGETGTVVLYPDFVVNDSKDLLVKGKTFYAIWDEANGRWSTNEYDVCRLVDNLLEEEYNKLVSEGVESINVRYLRYYESQSWSTYKRYLKDRSDSRQVLDSKLTFQNDVVKRDDYRSKRLPYPLSKNDDCPSWNEIVGTLYSPEEREKIEWAIGSIVAGDSVDIQKFIVFYGEAGAGKSTILNIIQQLFQGYYCVFEAKALASNNNSFALSSFGGNPLVAIQHDGDLSRIEDNSKLNSIISHEEMVINEKFKAPYPSRINCMLFMATNRPVKITDAKSGIIRRLIDVKPSGNKIEAHRYQDLMNNIPFELGGIARHCENVYKQLGKYYYDSYKPFDMIYQTDVFFNFVEDSYYAFKENDKGISLKQAYSIYKEYCDSSSLEHTLPKYKFREELKNYFDEFYHEKMIDGKRYKNWYCGFKAYKVNEDGRLCEESDSIDGVTNLVLDKTESIFDEEAASYLAQYANNDGVPSRKWENVKTCLSDLDTSKIHYVRVPENHIVIDFDLKNDEGEKDSALNLEAASKWPETYAEFSKGGQGVHLHYIYDGDVSMLKPLYSEGIEVKVFNGNSSLRRRLTYCNDIPIATISGGLPLKEEKKVLNFDVVKTEKGLRTLIEKNLKKEYHPGTKPSIDFIYKILEDAYKSGLKYDVSDLYQDVVLFARNSTHQAPYCMDLVDKMKFKSDEPSDSNMNYDEDRIVFFDVEVFPNLFLVNWKYEGSDHVFRMINPTSSDIEQLIQNKLVGFNCRRYDNHILYARYLGYTNEQLYKLSQRIISGSKNAFFGEAYNLSYTDVYDFAAAMNKKSLKKFEIELGIHHQELGLPWDEPVPEDKWTLVAEYCDNDVIATEAVFEHLKGDWIARQILAELSGLSVNDTTNQHSTKIIFGDNRRPQTEFIYTDLSTLFPGYTFDRGKSFYRDEEVGEGGYVYAEPGIYHDVALLDIASMHPSSIEALNLFGDRYTKKFCELKEARLAIKHKDMKRLSELLDGKLVPFVEKANDGEYSLKDLSNALKTVINSVYGLTSASFDNAFRDKRNKDNIVAKRGALFMVDLKHAVQEQGYTVAHIKTDSIKIPNADQKIIDFVYEFGKQWGYTFEHEATYDRMCLVNDAVYIAHDDDGWHATGAQFAVPYVFKTLFSGESLEFSDLCETKSVSTSIYLDMNENLPEDEHAYEFIGKVGSFCPIKPGFGGGVLYREKDGKFYAVTGTKGYRWLEAEMVKAEGKEDDIDMSYFDKLDDKAKETIAKYGDVDVFISGDK